MVTESPEMTLLVSLYPTVMYYNRYPVGYPTKNCVDNLREKRNNSVAQSIIYIFEFSAALHATKSN